MCRGADVDNSMWGSLPPGTIIYIITVITLYLEEMVHPGSIKGTSRTHQGYVQDPSRVHPGPIKGTSRTHQGYVQDPSRVHAGPIKGTSRTHQGYMQDPSRVHPPRYTPLVFTTIQGCHQYHVITYYSPPHPIIFYNTAPPPSRMCEELLISNYHPSPLHSPLPPPPTLVCEQPLAPSAHVIRDDNQSQEASSITQTGCCGILGTHLRSGNLEAFQKTSD